MSEKTSSSSSSSGIGFVGLLTIVFITLKLLKIITWSRWWVLCPLWIVPGIILVIGGTWLSFRFVIIPGSLFISDKIKFLWNKIFKKKSGKEQL